MCYLVLNLVTYLQCKSEQSSSDWYVSVSHLQDENDQSIHLSELLWAIAKSKLMWGLDIHRGAYNSSCYWCSFLLLTYVAMKTEAIVKRKIKCYHGKVQNPKETE